MTPEDARGYTDGLSFHSKQDVWGEFPNRYDHWDAFEAFETIANLRYEYAVQVEMSDGEWHFTDDEFYPFGTPEPRHAEWQTKTGAEELYASFVEDDGPKHIRIVRRLVSAPEVVA